MFASRQRELRWSIKIIKVNTKPKTEPTPTGVMMTAKVQIKEGKERKGWWREGEELRGRQQGEVRLD